MFQEVQALSSRAMETWEGVCVGQAVELLPQFPPPGFPEVGAIKMAQAVQALGLKALHAQYSQPTAEGEN